MSQLSSASISYLWVFTHAVPSGRGVFNSSLNVQIILIFKAPLKYYFLPKAFSEHSQLELNTSSSFEQPQII